MTSPDLMRMLDTAIEIPHEGVVNFVALRELLEAMIRQLGQQQPPVLEPQQSLPPGLSKDRDTKEPPGQQKDDGGGPGTGQQPREPEEQLPGKDTPEGARAPLQTTTGQLAGLQDQPAQGSDAEGSGGLSVPAEHPKLDLDTQHGESSAQGPKGPGTKTSHGTPRTESASQEMQGRSQEAPLTPEKPGGVASDQMRTSDTSSTTTGTQPESPSTQATAPGMQTPSPGTETTTLHTEPGATTTQSTIPALQPGCHSTQTSTLGIQPGSPGTHASTLGTQPAPQGTWLDAPSPRHGRQMFSRNTLAQAGHPVVQTILPTAQGSEINPDTDPRAMCPWQEPAAPWASSGSSSPAVEEAFRHIEQLGNLCAALKERVAQLETTKSDRTELENLRWLFPEGQKNITRILANLQGQVSSVQGLARDLQEKTRQLENALAKLTINGAIRKADDSGEITLPLGSTQHEKQQELKGEQQDTTKAMLKQSVTKRSEQLQAELAEPEVTAQSGGQEQAGCPNCNLDTRVQVAKLLQRCENLQELVESFMSQQMVGKTVRQLLGKNKQDELLKRIQTTATQVQGDYKQLSSVLRNLLDDHHQQHKAIEALFQALGKLKKQKADEEHLLRMGIDEKADKAALADKVSLSQFEAKVGLLHKMMRDVMSRATSQEQDWHQFQRRLQSQMDSKLDRHDLGSFQQQLEQRWKSLREKALLPERDNAAGIRKQLLADFHCLSCDRPLHMLVPGPEHTGECRYPTVPRGCGGPHTITPRRFQPQPSGTPRQLPPIAQRPNKDVMLLCQDGTSAGRQDGQLPVLGDQAGFRRDNPELFPRQRDTPDTESSLSQSGMALSEHRGTEDTLLSGRTPSSPEPHQPCPRDQPRPSVTSPQHRGCSPAPQPHQNGSAP